jgi:hypothetical protein
MNIASKIKQILEAAKVLDKNIFRFTHEDVEYILDITKESNELYLADEYKVTKRRSIKLANYNKAKSDKVLWIDEDGNPLGYGEEGKLKSIELANSK